MNATELIQSYFDSDAVARLARLVGLEPEMTGRVLEAGILLQLQALSQSARNPEGEAMIAEAVGALPAFGSVADALDESGGADHLQQAGEMLAPALLGEAANRLPAQVAAQTGADPASVQTLLQMTLPLLLSALGQRGLQAGNIAPMLASLGGAGLEDPQPDGAPVTETASETKTIVVSVAETAVIGAVRVEAEAVTPEAPEELSNEGAPEEVESVESPPAGVVPAALETSPPASVPPAPASQDSISPEVEPLDPGTPEGLLKFLQQRFGGVVGQQIGAVAGFGGGVRKQAALAALPVVLAALVGKAEAGSKLDALARPFAPLTDEDGQVNTALLDSPVEVARIEGQGRGLMASLFGDVNAVTGRLGSALGGSGDSSRRLLALLTPLVLSVLTRAQPAGLAALPWSGLSDGLKGTLPSGFSSLGVLIDSLASGTPLPGTAPTPAPAAPRSMPTGAPARPSPLKPPRPARFETPAPPPSPPARRGGGFPLWLIPLLLLLVLGGYWLVQSRQSADPVTPTPVPDTAAPTSETSTLGTAAGGGMPAMPVQPVFTDPQSGAAVPASGFTLRGTGPSEEVLEVFLGDTRVGGATVGPDGAWSLEVGDGAPIGPQTYTLRNAAGGEMAALNVVVGTADVDGADTTPAGTGGSDTTVPGPRR
ncbi:hypothetical protein GCM10008949_37230 [Deinococcus humi]|nr:hypothetical protein GCM10008949_37230 [Deinococcus humi]